MSGGGVHPIAVEPEGVATIARSRVCGTSRAVAESTGDMPISAVSASSRHSQVRYAFLKAAGRMPSRSSRFVALLLSALVASAVIAPICRGADNDALMVKATYRFRVTKGRGAPVCDAYLERLNTAKYDIPPYCDIPEDGSTSGFTKLNRLAITPDEAASIWPAIYLFATRQRDLPPRESWLPEEVSIFAAGSAWARAQIGSRLVAWKYDPPVSVNNDGKPDNVLIWRDSRTLEDGFSGKCGWVSYENAPPTGQRQPQIALILTPDDKKVDAPATK